MPPEREVVAYHEAGHAVAAVVMDQLKLKSVSIEEEDESHGHVQMSDWPDGIAPGIPDPTGEIDRFIRNEIAVFLAGPAAEERHSGYRSENVDTDEMKSWTLLSWIVDADDEQAWDVAFNECDARGRAIIETHWSAVDSLARALLDRGRLSGAEATDLIRRSLDTDSRHKAPQTVPNPPERGQTGTDR